MSTSDENSYFCSFCGKSQHEVPQLIAGPNVFICDECVELCMRIVLDKRTELRPMRPQLEGVNIGIDRLRREFDRDIDRWVEKLKAFKQLG